MKLSNFYSLTHALIQTRSDKQCHKNKVYYFITFNKMLKGKEKYESQVINELETASVQELLEYCSNFDCPSSLWKALFTANFPDLVDLVVVNDKTLQMTYDYRPRRITENESYWEMLYLELLSLNEEEREELQKHVNEENVVNNSSLLNYPFIVVFFGQSFISLVDLVLHFDQVEYFQYFNYEDVEHLLLNAGPKVVSYLLKNNDLPKDFLLSLFKSSVKDNKVEIIEVLLSDPRVDPSASNNYAIREASKYGHVEIVKLLLSDPRVDPSAEDNYAIDFASLFGRIKVVELLLSDPRVDPSANNNYAIRLASSFGHLEVVELLLSDSRVDPSANDNYAIREASRLGRIEVVQLLLSDPRVDPSSNNNYAIRWASKNGYLEVVQLLLSEPRVDPSADNNYALKWASRYGHVKVVQLLLSDPRVDPNAAR